MSINSEIAEQLMTVRDFIRWGMSQFIKAQLYYGHGTDNAFDDASSLVLHVAGIPSGNEESMLDARLTLEEKHHLLTLFEKRIEQRIPVPYLTGEAWFAGLSFQVDERVLIPRSPIAELIEREFAPWLTAEPVSDILDLCTGSGCIGIVCAHYFPDARVDLVDISADALDVANNNIHRHRLREQVKTVQSDLFNQLKGRTYQLIVSNPPYVDQNDFKSMPQEYQHEPELALSSGNDGLNITRRILTEAIEYLTDDGLLIVEVGNSFIALEEAFPDVPFTWIEFERGGHGVFVFSKQELVQYREAFG